MTCQPSSRSIFTVSDEQPVLVKEDGKMFFFEAIDCISKPNSSSVTLVGEADRKMLKAAIKHSSGEDQVRHRIIPTEVLQTWVEKLEGMTDEIAEILKEEKEEKHVIISFQFRIFQLTPS